MFFIVLMMGKGVSETRWLKELQYVEFLLAVYK